MRKIGIMTEKGGQGKTTSVVNLSAGLARLGKRVLAIDADPQANLSSVLSVEGVDPTKTLAQVLRGELHPEDTISPSTIEGVDLLPADSGLAGLNVSLVGEVGRETRLRHALKRIVGYDFLVVDTGPARSLVNVNVLVAVEEILVPIDPGLFALQGLRSIQEAIDQVVTYLGNDRLHLTGLFLIKLGKTVLARQVEERLRAGFGGLVLKTTVPVCLKVEEAHSHKQSVMSFAPRCTGSKAYQQLTEEVNNLGSNTNQTGSRDSGRRAIHSDDQEVA